jgi:hypothetical protein
MTDYVSPQASLMNDYSREFETSASVPRCLGVVASAGVAALNAGWSESKHV